MAPIRNLVYVCVCVVFYNNNNDLGNTSFILAQVIHSTQSS